MLDGQAWTPLRSIAYRLEHMTPGRRGRAVPARAAVRALQADGLVEVDDVLEGQAEAFKTVRVAPITAAGLERGRGSESSVPSSAKRSRAWRARRRAFPSPDCASAGCRTTCCSA